VSSSLPSPDNLLFRFTRFGAIAAFLAVGLGAFGAHALKDRLAPEMLTIYQTGVQYHMIHALALLFVGLFSDRAGEKGVRFVARAGTCFLVGILIFSGSLYALALTGVRLLGAITPLGGICFLSGWVFLALAASSATTGRREPER
jgi:uncharacterized membrane protein YgdD (TMEM256/DUF423 family)